MQLTLEQMQAITCGAECVTCEEGVFRFYRFTQQQMELYKNRGESNYEKCFHTSGVKLRFRTDSRTLGLDILTDNVVSRHYFAFEVFANGRKVGDLRNFRDEELTGDYAQIKLEHKPLSGSFALGEGEKEVCIYLPWSCSGIIRSLSLDAESKVEPVKHSKKLLTFGDSITHGYDARYPSNKYITRLAEALDAEEFNKAIGGEVFFPKLAAAQENITPDYVVVAYGTNDWRKSTKEAFVTDSRAFYNILSEKYPTARIFALTPVWRKERDLIMPAGTFEDAKRYITEAVEGLDNVTLISGYDLIPQDTSLFADLRLHPADAGFDHYFRNLYKKIRRALDLAE